jgi:small-conductance mechanosensitive channel
MDDPVRLGSEMKPLLIIALVFLAVSVAAQRAHRSPKSVEAMIYRFIGYCVLALTMVFCVATIFALIMIVAGAIAGGGAK